MQDQDKKDYSPAELQPGKGIVPDKATAGAFLVRDSKLLLEKRPDKARVYPGIWDTPGGHIEGDESPEETLVRELDEELGIKATRFVLGMVQDDVDPASGRFYRHYVFIVPAWEGEPASREARTIQWFSFEEVKSLSGLNPLIRFAFNDFLDKGWMGK